MVLIMVKPGELGLMEEAMPIHSNNLYSDLRDTIRQTWLRLSTKTPSLYKHLFVLGTKGLVADSIDRLNAESDKHGGDLLLLRDVTDSYQQLTAKTLAAIRLAGGKEKWEIEALSSVAVDSFHFKFLLKVDGDSFVRLGALIKSLQDIEHPQLYWGFLDGRARPFAKGKWLEHEWNLCDYYLPYQVIHRAGI
jgi:galactosylxylosylprotein 3-beta-galactosyltransferase